MAEVQLNLVENIDSVVNKGDAIMVWGRHSETGNKIKQLIICCPRCGNLSASAGNHIYDEETKSYSPSIVHNPDLGGCGYHGWLKNGTFTDV